MKDRAFVSAVDVAFKSAAASAVAPVDLSGLLLIEDADLFLGTAFKDILGTTPDESAKEYKQALKAGVPKRYVVHCLIARTHPHAKRFSGVWFPLSVQQLQAYAGEEFVRRAYQSILWRIPTSHESASVVEQLAGGEERRDIIRQLADSREAQIIPSRIDGVIDVRPILELKNDAEFIESAYRTILGRAPDAAGFGYWLGELKAGVPRMFVARCICKSAEQLQPNVVFIGLWKSASAREILSLRGRRFVVAAYRNALWRDPDPVEIEQRVHALLQGTRPENILYSISVSAEARRIPYLVPNIYELEVDPLNVACLYGIEEPSEFINDSFEKIRNSLPSVQEYACCWELLARGASRQYVVYDIVRKTQDRDALFRGFECVWKPLGMWDILNLNGSAFVREAHRSVLWEEPQFDEIEKRACECTDENSKVRLLQELAKKAHLRGIADRIHEDIEALPCAVVDLSALYGIEDGGTFLEEAMTLIMEKGAARPAVRYVEMLRRGLPRPYVVHQMIGLHAAPGRRFAGVWSPLSVQSLLNLRGVAFARSAYRSILWREPTADQIAGVMSKLQAGAHRIDILAELAYSTTARRLDHKIEGFEELPRPAIDVSYLHDVTDGAQLIEEAFDLLFGCEPNQRAMWYYNLLLQGVPKEFVIYRLGREKMESDPQAVVLGAWTPKSVSELLNTRTNAAFVEFAYQSILWRRASITETVEALSRLDSGLQRSRFLRELEQSPESARIPFEIEGAQSLATIPVDVSYLYEIKDPEQFIEALYHELFDRAPDAGAAILRAQLAAGVPRAYVLQRVLAEIARDSSRRFQGAWTAQSVTELLTLDTQEFIVAAYRSVLWRRPTAAELRDAATHLPRIGRREFLHAMASSAEAAAIPEFASGILDLRPVLADPDDRSFLLSACAILEIQQPADADVDAMLQILAAGASRQALLEALLAQRLEDEQTIFLGVREMGESTRALIKREGRDFVTAAYVALLGRIPTSEELLSGIDLISCGVSKRDFLGRLARLLGASVRAADIRGLISLPDLMALDKDEQFVRVAFERIIGRPIDRQAFFFYLESLKSTSRASVVESLMKSEEGRKTAAVLYTPASQPPAISRELSRDN